FLVLSALASFLAVQWSVTMALGAWIAARSPRFLRPWWWALVWTDVAAAASWWTPRVEADLLAYTQWRSLALIQAGSWGGPHLLGFVVVLVNAALAEAWLDAPSRASGPAAAPLAFGLAAAGAL